MTSQLSAAEPRSKLGSKVITLQAQSWDSIQREEKSRSLSLCQHSQDIPVLGLTLSNTPEEHLRRQLCHISSFCFVC